MRVPSLLSGPAQDTHQGPIHTAPKLTIMVLVQQTANGLVVVRRGLVRGGVGLEGNVLLDPRPERGRAERLRALQRETCGQEERESDRAIRAISIDSAGLHCQVQWR